MVVDPYNIIDYDRHIFELEEFLLFSVVVAGKTASVQSRLLGEFLLRENNESPFEIIRNMIQGDMLEYYLRQSKLGQYNKIVKSFTQIVNSNLDLQTCTVEDLEAIHGIGPKTARFFILHTRPNQRIAVLDTHILRFMRERLFISTPKSTPSGKLYKKLEQQFLDYVDTTGKSVAEIDLAIWSEYARS